MTATVDRIVLIGNFGEGHVGRHFRNVDLPGSQIVPIDGLCMYGEGWPQKVAWHFFQRKPLRIGRLVERLDALRPYDGNDVILVVGLFPLPVPILTSLRERGVKTAIYLTDDPFNPAHFTATFARTVAAYDVVFSPRRANFDDLQRIGARVIEYLPFAYDEATHVGGTYRGQDDLAVDVAFVGGADGDRIPFFRALVDAGFTVSLFGGYWARDPMLAPHARGIVSPVALISHAQAAKMQVVLARRANRDGHVMRSYEAAASRSCLLVEDTDDHRQMFGEEFQAVCYFRTPTELVNKAALLRDQPVLRVKMATAAFDRIVTGGRNTYANRLATILQTMSGLP